MLLADQIVELAGFELFLERGVVRHAVTGLDAGRQLLDGLPQQRDLVLVARGVVDQALHGLRHRVVALRHAIGREDHLGGGRLSGGLGVAQDHAVAAEWYRKAADKGVAGAQYNLGILYDQGNGVKEDAGEAARWFRKAADLGLLALLGLILAIVIATVTVMTTAVALRTPGLSLDRAPFFIVREEAAGAGDDSASVSVYVSVLQLIRELRGQFLYRQLLKPEHH